MTTPALTMLSVEQFLTKNGLTLTPHSPHSPSLIPGTFFLFLWMRKVLKRKRFADVEEVKQKMAEALKDIKIDEFKNCFSQ